MTKEPHFHSLSELRKSFTANQKRIIDNIEMLASEKLIQMQPVLQWNCLVYKYPNGSWIYCSKFDDGFVFGFGRGVKLIKNTQYSHEHLMKLKRSWQRSFGEL